MNDLVTKTEQRAISAIHYIARKKVILASILVFIAIVAFRAFGMKNQHLLRGSLIMFVASYAALHLVHSCA